MAFEAMIVLARDSVITCFRELNIFCHFRVMPQTVKKYSTWAVGKCTQLCKIVNIAEKFQELYLLKTVSVLVKSNRFC